MGSRLWLWDHVGQPLLPCKVRQLALDMATDPPHWTLYAFSRSFPTIAVEWERDYAGEAVQRWLTDCQRGQREVTARLIMAMQGSRVLAEWPLMGMRVEDVVEYEASASVAHVKATLRGIRPYSGRIVTSDF